MAKMSKAQWIAKKQLERNKRLIEATSRGTASQKASTYKLKSPPKGAK